MAKSSSVEREREREREIERVNSRESFVAITYFALIFFIQLYGPVVAVASATAAVDSMQIYQFIHLSSCSGRSGLLLRSETASSLKAVPSGHYYTYIELIAAA